MKASPAVRADDLFRVRETITLQKEGVENAEGVLRKLLSPRGEMIDRNE